MPLVPSLTMPMIDDRLVECLEKKVLGCACEPHSLRPDECVTCWAPRRVGKFHSILCGKRAWEFPYKLQVGPDWPVVVIVYCLILGITVPCMYLQYTYINEFVFVVGLMLACTLVYAYSATACSDPGIIHVDQWQSIDEYNAESEAKAATRVMKCAEEGIGYIAEKKGKDKESGGEGEMHNQDRNDAMVRDDVTAVADAGAKTEAEVSFTVADVDVKTGDDGAAEVEVDLEQGLPVERGLELVPTEEPKMTLAPLQSSPPTPGEDYNRIVKPRAPRFGTHPDVPNTYECSSCAIRRPVSSTHCIYCGVCVDELDHHCPWSGQCIAENNLPAFKMFVGTIGINCWFAAATFVWAMVIIIKASAGADEE